MRASSSCTCRSAAATRCASRCATPGAVPSGGSRWRVHVGHRSSRRAAEELGVSVQAFRDALLRYHLHDAKSRLVTGHFAWPEGLLEEFPDVSLVTLLRDPVAHFLSCYYEAREAGRSEQGLDAFLDGDYAWRVGTRFVRAFSGPIEPQEVEKPHAIEAACSRLSTVAAIGLLEDLPGFVDDFRQRFRVRLRLPHANAGPLRQRAERES